MVNHLVNKSNELNFGRPVAQFCRNSFVPAMGAKRNGAVMIPFRLWAQSAFMLQCTVKQVWVQCRNCNESWPSMHFRDEKLMAFQENESEHLFCAMCEAKNTHPERMATEVRSCAGCLCDKFLHEFAPVNVKYMIYSSERITTRIELI